LERFSATFKADRYGKLPTSCFPPPAYSGSPGLATGARCVLPTAFRPDAQNILYIPIKLSRNLPKK